MTTDLRQTKALASTGKDLPFRLGPSGAVMSEGPITSPPLVTERKSPPSCPDPPDLMRSIIGYPRENEGMCSYCTTWRGFSYKSRPRWADVVYEGCFSDLELIKLKGRWSF